MTHRTTRNLLWLALLLMAPAPVLLGVASGFMPVARVLMLAGVCLAVIVVEGAQGAVDLLALMLFAQALVCGVLWFAVAAAVARLLVFLPRRVAVAGLALALTVGVIVTSSSSWYRTPFRAAGTQANLWELFE